MLTKTHKSNAPGAVQTDLERRIKRRKMGILVLAVTALLAALLARMTVQKVMWRSSLAGALTCIGFYVANYINVGYFDPFSVISFPIVFGVGFLMSYFLSKIWPRAST